MKTLKFFSLVLAVSAVVGMLAGDLFAETRTLTTTIMVTIRAPQAQAVQAPLGLEDLYSVALTQNLALRLVKAEDALSTANGLPRYTMTEKL